MDYRREFIKIGTIFLMLGGIGCGPQSLNKNTVYWTARYQDVSNQIAQIYLSAWVNLQDKVDYLRQVEEENTRLRIETASLKQKLEALQFSQQEKKGQHLTQKFERRLSQETGTKIGRTLASMNYQPPADLSSQQLYTLGLTYLKAREDEKAAVIFSTLTGLEDTDTYRNARDLLITAMIWYRLDNISAAEKYFDEVLRLPEEPTELEYQAQARLWKAIIAKKAGKELKTQFWLRDLLDHHPHSAEAAWVNPLAGGVEQGRHPAAEGHAPAETGQLHAH